MITGQLFSLRVSVTLRSDNLFSKCILYFTVLYDIRELLRNHVRRWVVFSPTID